MTDPIPINQQPAIEAFPELAASPPMSYASIDELTDRHRAVAQLEVMGWNPKDIARELGDHPMTIYRVQSSAIYKVYVYDLRKQLEDRPTFDVPDYLQSVSEDTFRTMYNLMQNAESENVRGSMAKELADRIQPKVTKSQHEETRVIEFGDSIQNLASALADNLNVTQDQLTGKSDEEVIDLLESEVHKKEKEE